MNTDTSHFLEALLFGLPEDHAAQKNGWSIHEFHPDFVEAVTQFIYAFRDRLQDLSEENEIYADPDAGERSFGGDVYWSLSGHGVGFWDARDSEWGKAMQAALEAFAGGDCYRFEQIDLMKFNGKIHFPLRTAAFRRDELAKVFAIPSQP